MTFSMLLFLVPIAASIPAPLFAEQNLHQAARLLWQGDGVRVHDHQILTDEENELNDLCATLARETSPKYAWHKVSLVFDGDVSTKIDYGEAYRQRVLERVIPALKAECDGSVNPNIQLYNFISSVTIGSKQPSTKRVYRSVARWKEIQAIPWSERHSQGLDLHDEPLSECQAQLRAGTWTLRCKRYDDYRNMPLESYQSISGLIAAEQELNHLSEDQLHRLAAYEVAHSESRELARNQEWQERREEQRAAQEREWNQDACAEQPRISTQGPSAWDVCRAVAEQVDQANTTGQLVSAIWSAFTEGADQRPEAQFRLGDFTLRACSQKSDTAGHFECSYAFDLKRNGRPTPWADLVQGALTGNGNGEAELGLKGGSWRYIPPPPTPYGELPCCWLGDVRVRWGECRSNC